MPPLRPLRRRGPDTAARPELEWLADDRFRVGDVEFVDTFRAGSTAERFHIRKRRRLVEAYTDLLGGWRGARAVELGIAFGGSVALMELIARPALLVALELDPDPVQGLTDFISRRGIAERIRPHYGVNQADRERVHEIVSAELEGAPLDLVIDDASHLLGPTRASFETLFPLVRPGGSYLIEDWNWQHKVAEPIAAALRRGDPEALDAFAARREELASDPDAAANQRFRELMRQRLAANDETAVARFEQHLAERGDDPRVVAALEAAMQADAPSAAEQRRADSEMPSADVAASTARSRRESIEAKRGAEPLAALAIELVLARAWSGDVVADVHVGEFWITVTRGPAPLDPRSFRLSDTSADTFGLRWTGPSDQPAPARPISG